MIEVLLIDDDTDEQVIFSDAIECLSAPVRCTYAQSAEQALEILRLLVPDFIFVDMNMPRVNGIECIKMIKSTNNGSLQPIILYSTYMDEATCRNAVAAGAADCLRKTNTFPMLVEKLASYLSIA